MTIDREEGSDLKREYPDFPIAAVGAVIIHSDGRVLLIRRGTEPGRGKWSVPGGAVRLGEGLEAALIREVREECRLDVAVGPLLGVTTRIIRDAADRIRYHYVLIDYVCGVRKGSPEAGSDALDIRWFSVKELESLDTTEGITGLVGKGLHLIRQSVNLNTM